MRAQALGRYDTNIRAGAADENQRAQNLKQTQGKRKKDGLVDFTVILGRNHPGMIYNQLAAAQLDIDFPMYYKTE